MSAKGAAHWHVARRQFYHSKAAATLGHDWRILRLEFCSPGRRRAATEEAGDQSIKAELNIENDRGSRGERKRCRNASARLGGQAIQRADHARRIPPRSKRIRKARLGPPARAMAGSHQAGSDARPEVAHRRPDARFHRLAGEVIAAEHRIDGPARKCPLALKQALTTPACEQADSTVMPRPRTQAATKRSSMISGSGAPASPRKVW